MTFDKNKDRIAKNTLMLYCRMILTMVVSLYTSRVVLNSLGVTDYGVYNVVGGVVAMLGFFNSSVANSTQRFLNVGMTKESIYSLTIIFTTSVNAHLIIGIVSVALLETVGLWFVVNKLVIPEGQQMAAFWVYQCSVFSFFISVISVPYNAAIIAYERMSVFAIFSIIEVILKLGVAFAIMYYTGSKLVFYAFLLMCITLIMSLIYGVYCSKSFKEIRYRLQWRAKLVKEMMSYSGWMIFGCVSDLMSTQGVNMLINIFFGPVFNAARAIAVQVQSTVAQFSTNFMVSVNPQIVKSYASRELNYAYNLTFSASKFSFFLMMLIIIPIILRSQQILEIWLGIVPQDASIFLNLILIEYLIRSSYTPLATINQAGGNIRLYQLSIAGLFLLNFVLTYFLFKMGLPAYITFVVSAVIAFIGLGVRLMVLVKQQDFPGKDYLRCVSLRNLMVIIPAFIFAYIVSFLMSYNLMGLIFTVFASFVISISAIWFIGLNKTEKSFLTDKVSVFRAKLGII